jgi:hypothetical protein
VATQVRRMMSGLTTWTGRASDLLRLVADVSGDNRGARSVDWPKSPRALSSCLRRAQTSLRALGIEIAFSREGRAGTRIIMMSAVHPRSSGKIVSSVGVVSCAGPSNSGHPAPGAGHIHQSRG